MVACVIGAAPTACEWMENYCCCGVIRGSYSNCGRTNLLKSFVQSWRSFRSFGLCLSSSFLRESRRVSSLRFDSLLVVSQELSGVLLRVP